ncbi:MAG: radical SAM family heme chaperone HemW [Microbacterium sp.]|jgi:putative oxygen-independent coproporphyrinogen III oxidase|uniref:radical SAM family heme chaperone HemW n=1 Tax=unclassified Microbacterium TaxID=2609290 RepID=UPI000EE4DC66|nr:radical SAM family heme chaperone HemW [Microbacterium sp. UBA837]HAM13472.1 coproporphyrinogen III oxidase [Microbacterium sp.]HCU79453.1 coproporphyrinogen III oxidase [Microbacterium sp.]|tara:strand:- start:13227 stop:14435 length:1209 start_codon:yes stop_codon:yes gene_type:complete
MGAALPLGDPVPRDGSLPGAVIDPATPLSAYVHIPFCRVRCGYCDFNTYTGEELRGARREDYAGTLLREIDLASGVLSVHPRPLNTVFFGGGTPTLLPARDLAVILSTLRDRFGLEPDAEVTVEANPDTVTPEVTEELASAGVTRLSIGMQSAVPEVLRTLDRTHRPENVATAVSAARQSGLSVSVDLIYGAPEETLDHWRRSIEAALAMETDHISAYALIVEEGTALERRIRRGELSTPDDDLQAAMYEHADTAFEEAGYGWYEVSNWAKTPADRSRHNLAYWRGHDWWGFGPGAHSHVGGVRFWNVRHPAAYAQRLAAGDSPGAGSEIPDEDARLLERVMLRVRTVEGLPVSELAPESRQAVAGLVADGLVDGRGAVRGNLVLTRAGRLLADAVVRALTS